MTLLHSAKHLGLTLAAAGASPALSRHLLRGRGVIFMLHRFADPERGVPGHRPDTLRRSLEYLRARRFELVALEELIRGLGAPSGPRGGAVAFTIDDGYRDQAVIGGAVFAEFDCPVTTFVTTGFLDRKLWFWWDRIEFVFKTTRRRTVRVRLGDEVLEYAWRDAGERDRVAEAFTGRCKGVADVVKHQAIAALAEAAEVELPSGPPPAYAPMTWDDVRRCERRGMAFGPHTVTHPILARTGDHEAAAEIGESWRRLRAEAASPVPVFCYPNGKPGDYGEREYGILAREGLIGAVVGRPGYADGRAHEPTDATARFQVPRFAWPEDLPTMAQYVSGLHRLKQIVRGTT